MCRLFTAEDVDLIEQDMESLGDMFFAEGEGLPMDLIARIMHPITELLSVMQLATGILVDNFKQVRAHLSVTPGSLVQHLVLVPESVMSTFVRKAGGLLAAGAWVAVTCDV